MKADVGEVDGHGERQLEECGAKSGQKIIDFRLDPTVVAQLENISKCCGQDL